MSEQAAVAGEIVPGERWAELQSPLYWDDGTVVMLDQRALPGEEIWRRYSDDAQVATAIREMVIRGAPAIGCAAAMGLAAGARAMPDDPAQLEAAFAVACARMAESRPTAVNLFWAIDRQKATLARALAGADTGGAGIAAAARAALEREALAIWREDVEFCRAIGRFGAELVADGAHVLTHCNAGALATGGYGTALGVVRGAVQAGKRVAVYADETRPYLQGARLTAWELSREGIDVTLICDNMAGALMAKGEISCVVVGADRIAHNGDAANKIGTYSLAVLARHHEIPFYVAAPRSTIDRALDTGAEIPIEQRSAREVTHIGDTAIAPEGIKVAYPAFDVTPAALIDAIICEVGIARPPSRESIDTLFEAAS